MTPRQSLFMREYLVDLNATQAAVRAGYSQSSAAVQGCRLLANPQIRDGIAILQQERADRVGVTADRVLDELARIGFADSHQRIRWDDAVLVVETAAGVPQRIKMADKLMALEKIARHLGMIWTDDHGVDFGAKQ